jgi:peptidoglycan/xylan/chitin deacetylase (PgdA/CDA1 family)
MSSSLSWKRRIGRFYPPAAPGSSLVITYHSVGPGPLALPTNRFRDQMEWLNQNASVVDLGVLLSGNYPSSKIGVTCAVTFDDGYASVFQHAYPVLREFDLPATVYLVTGAVAEEKPRLSNEFDGLYPGEEMLTWAQITELASNGITFGSHLVSHKRLPFLSPEDARRELLDSKQTIEDRLGSSCDRFCYPWGLHDDRSVAAVREAGYSNAVITIHSRWWSGKTPDRYRIPRVDIRRDYSTEDFEAVVLGRWDYLGYVQRFRRLFD